MDVRREVDHAEQRIRPYVRETMLEPSPGLGAVHGADVHCKLEGLQHTGSFKVRGALNKVFTLSPEEKMKGVVAASTGNHGAAVAHAARVLGTIAMVFVPENADRGKVRTIERLGATVETFGADPVQTETHAREYARDRGLVYVSPYNDPYVIGGQGTVGVEMHRQLESIDAVFVALGGGGLVAGVAGYLKSVRAGVRVFACSPANSPVMIESVRAGRILDLPSAPTLSDGTAGGVERGAITFDLCRELVDAYVTVTEDEIADALRRFVHLHHIPIEGAAAVAVASYLKAGAAVAGRRVVIVICGANIDLAVLKRILSAGPPRDA